MATNLFNGMPDSSIPMQTDVLYGNNPRITNNSPSRDNLPLMARGAPIRQASALAARGSGAPMGQTAHNMYRPNGGLNADWLRRVFMTGWGDAPRQLRASYGALSGTPRFNPWAQQQTPINPAMFGNAMKQFQDWRTQQQAMPEYTGANTMWRRPL